MTDRIGQASEQAPFPAGSRDCIAHALLSQMEAESSHSAGQQACLCVQAFLKRLLTVDLPGLMVLPKSLQINIPPAVSAVAEAAVGRNAVMRAVASAVLQVGSLTWLRGWGCIHTGICETLQPFATCCTSVVDNMHSLLRVIL